MTDGPTIAERYHEATKYSPESIQKGQRQLDWASKPPLWKDYDGREQVVLATHLGLRGPRLEDALAALPMPPLSTTQLGLEHLARLLFFTNGVTRVVPQAGDVPFLMRAAPSAGGLYPTEVYVIAKEGAVAGLPGGAWNLDNRDLSLARASDLADPFARVVSATGVSGFLGRAKLIVALTGIFHRSAWRYEQRAYRRILLDTGHVLGNLVLSAERIGLAAVPVAGFEDAAIEEALGLAPLDEGGLVLVGLFAPGDAEVRPPRGNLALKGPIVLAENVPEDGVMKALHVATRLQAPLARAAGRDERGDAYQEHVRSGPLLRLPHAEVDFEGHVEKTILVRRSTRGFTGEPFSLEELSKLLHFAYQDRAGAATIDGSLLETYVAWNGASGGEAGVYYYRARSHEMVLINPGSKARECHAICLGQELGRDAAAVVFHTADLPRAVARYGDRAYRYLHLDAGHVGHRLNLAAIRLGLGASGIGGFFDDHANALLALPPRAVILYPTCLGRPAEGAS